MLLLQWSPSGSPIVIDLLIPVYLILQADMFIKRICSQVTKGGYRSY